MAWREDPVLFCTEVLGVTPWHTDGLGCATQRDIMRSVATSNRVTICSGHKCGKSFLCAALALWEFVCWPGSRTIITAPTYRQVNEVIWREVHRLHGQSRLPIGGRLAQTPNAGLHNFANRTQVFGFSTNDSDRFSGLSGRRVTYILDEASGISPVIYKAIAGNRMGGARLIMISNPTQPTGEFYDSFHSKASLYERHHISSVQVAEAVERGDIKRIPGIADAEMVREFTKEWGKDSDDYRVRVDGQFASQGALSVVSADDYDAAVARYAPIETQPVLYSQRLELGIDVGHFGDDPSVIVGRRGRHVMPPESHHKLDGPQMAMKVWNYVQRNRTHRDESAAMLRPRVRIEAVGVGVSLYDALRHQFGEWLDIVKFDPAGRSRWPRKFANMRAEAWFNARKVLGEAPYQLPAHEKMRNETLTPQYLYDAKNRYLIEPKKELKKRLGSSPDHGDALVICLWDPPEGFGRLVRIPGL